MIAYSEVNNLNTEYVLDTIAQFKTELIKDKKLQNMTEVELNKYAVYKAFEKEGNANSERKVDSDFEEREGATVQSAENTGFLQNSRAGLKESLPNTEVVNRVEIGKSDDRGKRLSAEEGLNFTDGKDIKQRARQLMINDRLNSPSMYFVYTGKVLDDKSEYYGIDKGTIHNFGRSNNFRRIVAKNVSKKYHNNPDEKDKFDYYIELAKAKGRVETEAMQSLAVNTFYSDSVFQELESADDPLRFLNTFDKAKIDRYCKERFVNIPFYRDQPEKFVRLFTQQVERGKACLVFYSAFKKDVELLKRYGLSSNIQGGLAVAVRSLYGSLVRSYDPQAGREYIREAKRISRAVRNTNDIGMSWLGAGGGNLLFSLSETAGYATFGVLAVEAMPVIAAKGVEISSGTVLLGLLEMYKDHVGIEIDGRNQGISKEVISRQQENKIGRTVIDKTVKKVLPYMAVSLQDVESLKDSFTDSPVKIEADSLNIKQHSDNMITGNTYRDVILK